MIKTLSSGYQRLKRSFGIKWRLLGICYLLVIIPTVILGLLSYRTFATEMRKTAVEELQFISRDWHITARVYKEQLDRMLRREMALTEKLLFSTVSNTHMMLETRDTADIEIEELDSPHFSHFLKGFSDAKINRSGYITIMDSSGKFVVNRHTLFPDEHVSEYATTETEVMFSELFVQMKKDPSRAFVRHYRWREKGETVARERVSVFRYYAPRDWYIFASTYYTDFRSYDLKRILQDELKRKMAEHYIRGSGYIWVVNSQGDYIVSKDRLRDGENIIDIPNGNQHAPVRHMIDAVRKLQDGESYVYRYMWRNIGEPYPLWKVSVMRYLPEWDWYIGTSAYEHEYLHGLKQIRNYIIVVCLLAIFIGSLVGYAFALRVARPIERLDAVAQAAAGGDLTADLSAVIERGGEIGRLAESFSIMMSNLKGKIWEVELALVNREKINAELQTEITERLQAEEELRENEGRFQTLFDSANDAIFIMKNAQFVDCNLKTLEIFGCTREQIIGQPPYRFSPEYQPDGELSQDKVVGKIMAAVDGEPQRYEWTHMKYDGTPFPAEVTLNAIVVHGETYLQAIIRDISERLEAEQGRLQLEKDLSHARKLESIGTLASGIAHEINTPVQFVGDNVRFFSKAVTEMQRAVKMYQEARAECREGDCPHVLGREDEFKEIEGKLSFIQKELPDAIHEAQEGLLRVTTVINAMKNYSHINQDKKVEANLNKAIESTVVVARNEWKYVAEVDFDLEPELPAIYCYLAELNQVIMNILINATHAIKAHIGEDPQTLGKIRIRTYREDANLMISISDTGGGIPENVQSKVFDPFFTTKDVGIGTGQGLSIAYQIIVEKHNGRIWFDVEPGVGTTFYIALPWGERSSSV